MYNFFAVVFINFTLLSMFLILINYCSNNFFKFSPSSMVLSFWLLLWLAILLPQYFFYYMSFCFVESIILFIFPFLGLPAIPIIFIFLMALPPFLSLPQKPYKNLQICLAQYTRRQLSHAPLPILQQILLLFWVCY